MRRRAASLLAAACVLVAASAGGAALAIPASAHPSDSVVDADHDGSWNHEDNCPDEYNPDQADLDGDGDGDRCDLDDDADGVEDITDNCQFIVNPGQHDLDGDSAGDPCDSDDDGDGVFDSRDNCPRDLNPRQDDADGDRLGDACDPNPGTPGPAPTPTPGPTPPAGGPGPAPGSPPGSAPASDDEPPDVDVSLRRDHRLEALANGLSIRARCSERCVLVAQVLADRRTARRLGLRGAADGLVVGAGNAALAGPGSTFVFTELSRRVTRGLARGRLRRAELTVRLVAADAAGNERALSRRIRIRR